MKKALSAEALYDHHAQLVQMESEIKEKQKQTAEDLAQLVSGGKPLSTTQRNRGRLPQSGIGSVCSRLSFHTGFVTTPDVSRETFLQKTIFYPGKTAEFKVKIPRKTQ